MADEQLDAPRLIDPVMVDLERVRDVLNVLNGAARALEEIAVLAEQKATEVTTVFRNIAEIVEPWLAEQNSPNGVEDSEP